MIGCAESNWTGIPDFRLAENSPPTSHHSGFFSQRNFLEPISTPRTPNQGYLCICKVDCIFVHTGRLDDERKSLALLRALDQGPQISAPPAGWARHATHGEGRPWSVALAGDHAPVSAFVCANLPYLAYLPHLAACPSHRLSYAQ